MTVRFEFATAARIVFGSGAVRELGGLASEWGRRAMWITGRHPQRMQAVVESLTARGVTLIPFKVDGEPTLDTVRQGTRLACDQHCELVIGCGGGSVLDAGKAIAALLTNAGDPLDYVEVIGRGRPITKPSAPFVAVPTTAGTGTEVTRNAVLGSPEHRVKVSMRSPLMLPRLAIIDPDLTLQLPPALTASTGLDALTQLIEPFVSSRANPLTDAICWEGLRRAARSLRRAYEQGDDRAAREDMALASLFGGLALANAGLGAVHGFAAPIGGMFAAPHGAVCAALLPHVMEVNLAALRQRKPDGVVRYEEVARILTGNAIATAEAGVAWVKDMCQVLRIPPLSAYGVKRSDFAVLIEKASAASSMKANPIPLCDSELLQMLERSLE